MIFIIRFGKMTLFVFCAFFLLAVASASSEENLEFLPRENLILCNPGDTSTWKILKQETVSAPGKFLQVVERTKTFPKSGIWKPSITCIKITDLVEDGSGGIADIADGGLDQHYVTLHFVSKRSKGFKFSVEIWGDAEPDHP